MAKEYDWDNLEVGQFDLNHSENFFRKKHIAHEKLEELNLEFLTIMDDKENIKTLTNNVINKKEDKSDKTSNKSSPSGKILNIKEDVKDAANVFKQPLRDENVQIAKRKKKIQTIGPPSLYKYAEFYEKKKQRIKERMLENEKKLREFHSKPAPNFKKSPRKLERKEVVLTTPTTPLVLKHSRENEERKKRLIEELNKPPPPLKPAREAKVLREEPFKPQKSNQHTDVKPFNLHMERRLEQRKQYDKEYKRLLQEKKTQEEIDNKKREEELLKEIRKNRVFKARPNPFK